MWANRIPGDFVLSQSIKALPLTIERFRKFGDVLEATVAQKQAMNSARFERFSDLASIDVGAGTGGRPCVSIARCRTATAIPYRIDMLERHPRGSQSFMPLSYFRFYVVVAPAGETVEQDTVEAFVTNGRQGVNYHVGVWHMPMIAMQSGQEFLVLDRAVDGGQDDSNCDELYLDEPILLEDPAA